MRNEELNVMRGDVKRDRNIDPPALRKGGNCHVRALIGHRGTNWKRRRWHLERGTKTCLFRVLYLRCTTTAAGVLLLSLSLNNQFWDSLCCVWKTERGGFLFTTLHLLQMISIGAFRCFKYVPSLVDGSNTQRQGLNDRSKPVITSLPSPFISGSNQISTPPPRCATAADGGQNRFYLKINT